MNESFTDKHYLLDTSSLLDLVRYYLPFDGKQVLFGLFRKQFEKKNFILCEPVYKECESVAGGVTVSKLGFLKGQHKLPPLLVDEKIDKKSLRERSRGWRNQHQLRKIAKDRRSKQQQEKHFLEIADSHLIGYALRDDSLVVVTDETPTPNDRKLYHKIPHIMKIEGISNRCINLPELLPKYVGAEWRLRN